MGRLVPDSRAQAATITAVKQKFKAQGLQVFAPTRLYKYALNVENPTPEQESASIELVWKQFFAGLSDVPHPIDDAAMEAYGVSSTPTLVLIDSAGIVRMYQPSRMTEESLTRKIEAMLGKN